MTRSEILEQAKKCVCGAREQEYGKPEDNFRTIAQLWSAYLAAAHPSVFPSICEDHIGAKDVAAMMALLKIARIATGNSPDSFIDLAGYAACGGEIVLKELFKNENACVSCGKSIPEGKMYCPECGTGKKDT